jgi:hypothetical protein
METAVLFSVAPLGPYWRPVRSGGTPGSTKGMGPYSWWLFVLRPHQEEALAQRPTALNSQHELHRSTRRPSVQHPSSLLRVGYLLLDGRRAIWSSQRHNHMAGGALLVAGAQSLLAAMGRRRWFYPGIPRGAAHALLAAVGPPC